ncbi:MAG TPA: hypothetical protein DCQ26_00325 [Marinilabiliales bacterium]|nr:MAG: hypothetical protein A2W95_03820 [Bacteroidetes bacterium GWA2_40_14]OFX75227.1 MAG: hypothetical protein A2W96_16650 [Bacteroidetes bacterium GWD2_40_43]OFX89824.1 MAG: hypothetical protein A2W97_12310 [Bacteroidetes bacterium GWE2_40_63]OFY21983.1 MAG: hypothetical protein A2W88_00535 [Bacteroidetes bacterium GWF2_40_13]OFZ30329.1 MAG: hypothetical protein A2437_09985 [Bacteroidetes bacterium RIFOXYC2_FULL_40_12]HAM97033.1 hypothetical protein [Marinilabiliales bacterium]
MGTTINVHDNGKVDKINTTESGDIVINKPSKRQNNPWISGSFYMTLFILIISLLTVSAKILPFYVFPITLIGTMLLFSIIGAFQLKNDGKHIDKNFLKLMFIAFRYIPFLTNNNKNNT